MMVAITLATVGVGSIFFIDRHTFPLDVERRGAIYVFKSVK